MAIVKVRLTTPGQRGVVKIVHKHLYKGRPKLRLRWNPKSRMLVAITMATSLSVTRAVVISITTAWWTSVATRTASPRRSSALNMIRNRTAHIALVCYVDGERRYIIVPRNLEVGSTS